MVGARRHPAEIGGLVERVAVPGPEWWRTAVLEGLARGLSRTHADVSVLAGVRPRLLAMIEGPSAVVRHAALELLAQAGLPEGPGVRSALERAAARAADGTQDPAARADGLGLLALAGPDRQVTLLQGLVDPLEPEPV